VEATVGLDVADNDVGPALVAPPPSSSIEQVLPTPAAEPM